MLVLFDTNIIPDILEFMLTALQPGILMTFPHQIHQPLHQMAYSGFLTKPKHLVDMVLIGIYSGWRPQELAVLKTADIDLITRQDQGSRLPPAALFLLVTAVSYLLVVC